MAAEPEMKEDFFYIDVLLKDSTGNLVTDRDIRLNLHVEGCAVAAGFGSGNPKPSYNFNEGVTETFHGRAQIILMRTGSGEINVQVSSEDGKHAKLNLMPE